MLPRYLRTLPFSIVVCVRRRGLCGFLVVVVVLGGSSSGGAPPWPHIFVGWVQSSRCRC